MPWRSSSTRRLRGLPAAGPGPAGLVESARNGRKRPRISPGDPTGRTRAGLPPGCPHRPGRPGIRKAGYTAAMEEFSELIAENKKDIEALAGRGNGHGNLFRYEKAIPDLD